MQPLPRPSVSPLYSFCSVRPDPVPRYVSFAETFGMVRRWLRGVEPEWRQRTKEARLVDALAEVMAAETEMDEAAEAETETINPASHETEISQSHGRDESHGRARG
jgi:hypothetical protein